MANKPVGNRSNKFRGPPRNQKQKIKGGVTKRITTKPRMQDARQKIIQKKRKTVVDARDILAKMAKTQDARNKLNKIRHNRNGSTPSSSNVKVIGNSILRKTDRNGKISLSTNKTKNTSEMNLAIQKQLGLISAPPRPAGKRAPPKRNPPVNNATPRPPLVIRKTILNDLDFSSSSADSLARLMDSSLYKWTKPDMRTASHMINSLENRRLALKDELLNTHGYLNYVAANHRPLRLAPSGYIDLDAVEDDEEMPLAQVRPTISLQGSSRVSNIHSRLDTSPSMPESHGIMAQTKTKVVVPAGHRIVVSNLQSTVTQDDIKELFEDIGQLLAARLVRPGVAEVIYKNLKDAQKAVDTYHNRQLDGQPMKCLLVNKRPLNQPTAPALSKSDGILAARKAAASIPSSNKLVPDISTIHKVLFQRK